MKYACLRVFTARSHNPSGRASSVSMQSIAASHLRRYQCTRIRYISISTAMTKAKKRRRGSAERKGPALKPKADPFMKRFCKLAQNVNTPSASRGIACSFASRIATEAAFGHFAHFLLHSALHSHPSLLPLSCPICLCLYLVTHAPCMK